jgi:hypothetical protein
MMLKASYTSNVEHDIFGTHGYVDCIIDVPKEQLLAISRGELKLETLEVTPPPAHYDPAQWSPSRLKSILGYFPRPRDMSWARQEAARVCRRRIRYAGTTITPLLAKRCRWGILGYIQDDVRDMFKRNSQAKEWLWQNREALKKAYRELPKSKRLEQTGTWMESRSEEGEIYTIETEVLDWTKEQIHEMVAAILPPGVKWDRTTRVATWPDGSEAEFDSYNELSFKALQFSPEEKIWLSGDDFCVGYLTQKDPEEARKFAFDHWRAFKGK